MCVFLVCFFRCALVSVIFRLGNNAHKFDLQIFKRHQLVQFNFETASVSSQLQKSDEPYLNSILAA